MPDADGSVVGASLASALCIVVGDAVLTDMIHGVSFTSFFFKGRKEKDEDSTSALAIC